MGQHPEPEGAHMTLDDIAGYFVLIALLGAGWIIFSSDD